MFPSVGGNWRFKEAMLYALVNAPKQKKHVVSDSQTMLYHLVHRKESGIKAVINFPPEG